MPIPLIGDLYRFGLDAVPGLRKVIPYAPHISLLAFIRWYCSGATNGDERVMHGKVAIITGGTSGIGKAVAYELASRGCQIVLLMKNATDAFAVDQIEDMRQATGNMLIYAEECDLSSLHSIRLFATKWINNSPPRRLDLVICCAGVMAPPFSSRIQTQDGIEQHWGINYVSHFHLVNILTPCLKAQPPDRDVRVMFATCTAYVMGSLDLGDPEFAQRGYPSKRPWICYGASKMALMAYAIELQRRLDAYERPDKLPMNVRTFIVEPGYTRSPGMRRWLSMGSILGLLFYLITWPFWWLILKSTKQAAQTFLTVAMSRECGQGNGGRYLRECRFAKLANEDVKAEILGKQLWDLTNEQIEKAEKASAIRRKKEEKAKKQPGKKSTGPMPKISEDAEEEPGRTATGSDEFKKPAWATKKAKKTRNA